VTVGGAGRHWTGKTIPKLIAAIADSLEPIEREKLWRMHDLSYRLNNLLLHHSPHALAATVVDHVPDAQGPGVTVLSRRPSERYVRDSLQSAYYSLSRLGRLVMRPGHERELEEQIATDEHLFVRLPADVLRDTRRNDPCPCGSGRKFKQCHGR
jgi:SEC-C motif